MALGGLATAAVRECGKYLGDDCGECGGRPVNHELQRAVRKAYLQATLYGCARCAGDGAVGEREKGGRGRWGEGEMGQYESARPYLSPARRRPYRAMFIQCLFAIAPASTCQKLALF